MTVFMAIVNGFPSDRKGFFMHTHAYIIGGQKYHEYTLNIRPWHFLHLEICQKKNKISFLSEGQAGSWGLNKVSRERRAYRWTEMDTLSQKDLLDILMNQEYSRS